MTQHTATAQYAAPLSAHIIPVLNIWIQLFNQQKANDNYNFFITLKTKVEWNTWNTNIFPLSLLRVLRLLICSMKALNPLNRHELNLLHIQYSTEMLDRGWESPSPPALMSDP